MQDIKTILDIGNWRIKAVVISEEEGKRTTLHKEQLITKGIRKGKILEEAQFVETIQTAITWIHKKIGGEYVDEYVVSISHPHMKRTRIREQKRVMKEKVTQEDIRHLSNIIADISEKDNQEVIKILPVYRIINEKEKVKDPLGMKADKIDIVADIFYLPKTFYASLMQALEMVDIDYVADIIPNTLCTAEASIDYDTRDLWAITIDIGKEHTSFIIYEDGYPLRYETIPIWWDSVTKDISIGMQIDIKEAELLKVQSWVIGNEEKKKDNDTIDTLFLSQIITARYEEILEKINDRLKELQREWRLAWGVIFSWGWSKIKNLAPLARDIFQLAVYGAEDVHDVDKSLKTNLQFINALWCYMRSSKHTAPTWWLGINFQLGSNIIKWVWNMFKKRF